MSKWSVRAKVLSLCSEAMAAWAVALVALVAGVLLSAALALATQTFYKQQLRQRFELLAAERFSRIAERFDDQEQRLDGLRRFFSYSSEITPREFDGYARPLLHRTQAYSWAPRVEAGQRRAFERTASAALGQDYVIREQDAQGQWHPSPARDHYFPVLYTQATQQQGQPYGLDLRSQASREQTLLRALQPGSMAVSAPLDMINVDPDFSRGLLMVAPVFVDGEPAVQPTGYVMALLNLRQLISEGLPVAADDNLAVRVVDPSGRNGQEVLYDSRNPAAPLPLLSSQLLHLADHHRC